MSDKIVLDLCAELCSHRKQLETELKETQDRLDSAVEVIKRIDNSIWLSQTHIFSEDWLKQNTESKQDSE